ncbi:MAG: DUF2505 domain-containing protein [Mycobacteriales bacterium]
MRVEHTYDATPKELLEVLTDQAFLAARSRRFGGDGTPKVRRSGGTILVTVPRKLPLDAVPGPFRGMVGSGQIVQTDTWSEVDEERVSGTWTTDTGDTPLDLDGTHEILATDEGCSYVVTATVKVRVRFIGGQAEGLVRQQLAELVGREQDFAASWLAGERE